MEVCKQQAHRLAQGQIGLNCHKQTAGVKLENDMKYNIKLNIIHWV